MQPGNPRPGRKPAPSVAAAAERGSLIVLCARICRRALLWGAPAILAACSSGIALTPDELLVQQLALINGGRNSSAPGAVDPVFTVSISSVNGDGLCKNSCPVQITVPAGRVSLEVVCRYTAMGAAGAYPVKLAAEVMAGHIYELRPAADPGGCAVTVADVTRKFEKPKSGDNPGIRG